MNGLLEQIQETGVVAASVRKEIANLDHHVDIFEAMANLADRGETILLVKDTLQTLRRDLERFGEMLDDRRVRILQLDRR